MYAEEKVSHKFNFTILSTYICENMQLVNETHLQKTIDFSILIDYIFYEAIMILKSQELISLY